MTPKAPNGKLGTPGQDVAGGDVPTRTLYFGLTPSTPRYRRVFALARARDCPWQDVIRDAIDAYLTRFPPEKPV